MSSRFAIARCSLVDANALVSSLHRHGGPVLIAQESVIAVDRATALTVGAGILGLPLHQSFCDGLTLEIRRTATDGTEHACSAIIGALCRAARRRGALRVITYTRSSESGASLRGSGFTFDIRRHRDFLFDAQGHMTKIIVPTAPRSWTSPGRPGRLVAKGEPRFRWFKVLPGGKTEDGAMALGEAAGRMRANPDTNPFDLDWEPGLWALWRECYDYGCRLPYRAAA